MFDVAVGERAISHMGHIKMMGAVQPFISGAISKTVNLPQECDGGGHRRRLHAGVAPRRQGARDLPRRLEDRTGAAHRRAAGRRRSLPTSTRSSRRPSRRRWPRRVRGASGCRVERQSITHKFSIAGHEGYITAGMYEDGSVGEIFLTDIGKEGSTLRGMMNSFATAISIALQYGVPLETLVQKFSYMRFEPEGITGNPEIPFAKSMPDYIMRWLASRFLDVDAQEELGILTPAVRARKTAQETAQSIGRIRHRRPRRVESRRDEPRQRERRKRRRSASASSPQASAGGGGHGTPAAASFTDSPPVVPARLQGLDLGPACSQCGGMMQRTGSCYTCSSCGNNTGCG